MSLLCEKAAGFPGCVFAPTHRAGAFSLLRRIAAERGHPLLELASGLIQGSDRLFFPEGVYWTHLKCGGVRLEVYLDLMIILNFSVDFLLLLGTNRISGFPAAPGRCALGAALGAGYAAACLVPGFRFLGGLGWRCVSLALMGAVSFGCSGSALKRCGVFLLLSLAMGGAALSVNRGDLPGLILTAVLLWLVVRLSFPDSTGGQKYVPVNLRYGKERASIIALRDTGNTLRDPITGEQVIVVSGTIGQRLTGLTEQQLRAPLQTMEQRPLPGMRLIPFRSVGCSSGFLLGLRMDQVTVGNRKTRAVVAFSPEGFGKMDVYQGLTGGV